ncbi:MAG: transporter [Candidatus Aminicenantia bacterium]
MKILRLIFLFTLLSSFSFSHHGVASLGTSGINGPGAPLETSTSFNIPKGKYLIYFKYDDVTFKKFTQERDDEKDFNNFLNFGIGFGATPYLSFYIFQPYNVKVKEDFSFNTAGFADLCLLGVFGFKYDEGFKLIPQEENLDDLKDFHFTIYSGMTIPSGDANLKNSEGEVEPDMSLGFGKSSFMLGFTTTKQISDKFTSSAEVSFTKFLENVYTDGRRYKFGD